MRDIQRNNAAESDAQPIGHSTDQTIDASLEDIKAMFSSQGPHEVPDLVALLDNGDATIREFAVTCLALKSGISATRALVKAASDPCINVRLAAASSLGLVRDECVVPALIQLLGDNIVAPFANASLLALDALAVPALLRAFRGEGLLNDVMAHRVAGVIARIGGADALFEIATCSHVETRTRSTAFESIKQLGIKALPLLIANSTSTNWEIAEIAISLISDIGASHVSTIIGAMADDNPSVASALGRALAQVRPTPLQDLLAALRSKDCRIICGAARALGLIREPESVWPLTELYHSGNPDVRREAIVALGRIATVDAARVLVSALTDPDLPVRTRAANALVGIGRPALDVISRGLRPVCLREHFGLDPSGRLATLRRVRSEIKVRFVD